MMKKILGFLAAIAVSTLLALYFVTGSFSFLTALKNDIAEVDSKEDAENLLQTLLTTVRQEISNPAPLIWKINSLRSHLTNEGTFNETNIARASTSPDLGPLAHDLDLDRIAEARLEDMFAKQYFEHFSPEGIGAAQVAEEIGYEYAIIAENIALGNFENDKVLVQAWMDSPGHRANILNKSFTHLGVAVGRNVYQGRATWIAVQIFAKPKSLCPDPSTVLKKEIDVLTAELKNQKRDIDADYAWLEKNRPRPGENPNEYNKRVSEYNEEVRLYSAKADLLKKKINEYNAQVVSFNKCTAG
jgi:uncharacterized protein YkwD